MSAWRVSVYVAELKQQIETLRKLRRDDELELVKLRAELKKDAKLEQLLMAVGCASTIKGSMVMRPDDPFGMMQEVCSYVQELRLRDEAVLKLARETELYRGASEAQKQREIAACERAKIPYGGCDTVHDLADLIVVLIRERDEAIGLLKWVVDKFATVKNILPQMAHYDLGEGLVDVGPAKRILELTAK